MLISFTILRGLPIRALLKIVSTKLPPLPLLPAAPKTLEILTTKLFGLAESVDISPPAFE